MIRSSIVGGIIVIRHHYIYNFSVFACWLLFCGCCFGLLSMYLYGIQTRGGPFIIYAR